MSEEFIVQDQERGAGSPFLILAGILGAVFFLAIVCIGAVLLSRGTGDETDPSAEGTRIAVVSTNEAIMTQNAFVTQTLIARTMTAAAPTNTNTPAPTATITPSPTATNTPLPTPTETPVISTDDGTEVAEGPTPTTSIFGTPIFGTGGTGATPTPVVVTGGTGSTGGTGGGGTLPQTGMPLWGIIGLGAGLIVLIGVIRRLRTS